MANSDLSASASYDPKDLVGTWIVAASSPVDMAIDETGAHSKRRGLHLMTIEVCDARGRCYRRGKKDGQM